VVPPCGWRRGVRRRRERRKRTVLAAWGKSRRCSDCVVAGVDILRVRRGARTVESGRLFNFLVLCVTL